MPRFETYQLLNLDAKHGDAVENMHRNVDMAPWKTVCFFCLYSHARVFC